MNPQARLGAFVLLALLALGLLSARIGRMHLFSDGGAVVEAVFNDVGGLEEQTPVRLAGVRVGRIESIRLDGARALVRIRLQPGITLPASTRATLVSSGLVGEKYVALKADPDDARPLPPGKRIPVVPSGSLDALMDQAADIADSLRNLANAGMKTVNSFSSILDENRADLRGTMHNLNHATKALDANLPPALADARKSLKRLPPAIDAGRAFFREGERTFRDLDDLLIGNRENLYRMIFEFRKTAENLEALSDDLRRNPWKLMNKQREKPPAPHAKERLLEEYMLSTGRMGLVPPKR